MSSIKRRFTRDCSKSLVLPLRASQSERERDACTAGCECASLPLRPNLLSNRVGVYIILYVTLGLGLAG
eukprot:2808287-Amphidinium_carterae.1